MLALLDEVPMHRVRSLVQCMVLVVHLPIRIGHIIVDIYVGRGRIHWGDSYSRIGLMRIFDILFNVCRTGNIIRVLRANVNRIRLSNEGTIIVL